MKYMPIFLFKVTSVIDNTNHDSSANQLIPCLGLAWSNLVNTRFQIHKTKECLKYHEFDENDEQTEELVLTVRKFDVIFSPELSSITTEFLISPEGVIDVPYL